jgi:hypothetical protein
MPSSPNYKRNYKQERKTAASRGETGVGSKSGDATRHRARRLLAKALGKDIPGNKDVDHKKKLKSGGTNSVSNLRVRSKSSNRSDNGHSKKNGK